MIKSFCLVAILACVILLQACSLRPIEELNQSVSSRGLRMTATDLYVERCLTDDDTLIVTTFFLVENTNRWRTISTWIESSYDFRDISEVQQFSLEDIPPGESMEFYVTIATPSDAFRAIHGFYIYHVLFGHKVQLSVFSLVLDMVEIIPPSLVMGLNQPYSNAGLCITATDMCVEPCPLDDGNFIATTYFLVENTTSDRSIAARVESYNYITLGKETFYIEDLLPQSEVEFYATAVVNADQPHVGHSFYLNMEMDMEHLVTFFLTVNLPR